MNATLLNTAAGLLVCSSVLAGANLVRVLIVQDQEARRAILRRRLWPGTARRSARTPTLCSAVSGLILLAPAAALAQSPDSPAQPSPPASAPLTISTDRPSFSDGTGIQPQGHFNLETGYTFTHRDRDGVETNRHNGPEVLGRIGLIDDRLELRVIWSGLVDSQIKSGGVTTTANGLSDVTLGFKLKLADQGELAAWAPRLAFEAQTTLGAGGADVSTQEEEPAVKLLWSYDLAACCGQQWGGWSIGGNLNTAWPTSGEGTGHFEQYQASIYVNAPLFDRCTGFAEYYLLTPNTDGGSAAHYADMGAVYLLTPRIQLDARVGFGLNNQADNFFTGIGISFLF